MRVRLLLGPAGSGKTFRCLAEARDLLVGSAEGPPLLLVAPKQTTWQLERQLLSDTSLGGYTRLHIVSFERLAGFIFERLHARPPRLLDEEGRLMVLRSLLARKRDDLKLFRASARLTGFAQQLSLTLRQLQRHQHTPESLRKIAEEMRDHESLSCKLHDFSSLLREYLDWLEAHDLRDADCLLSDAAEALRNARNQPDGRLAPKLRVSRLWVDGFPEFSPSELELIATLLPNCEEATVTFCLDEVPGGNSSWLSPWSVVRRNFERCCKRFGAETGIELDTQRLERKAGSGRFQDSPVLRELEKHWGEISPSPCLSVSASSSLRLAVCADPEGEAMEAAREILRYVRSGGRYREVSVLVRKLDGYHQPLERVFVRFEIPFFLDRRESVSHHPLAELTRSTLRTLAFGWRREDWFGALKSGLAGIPEPDLDRLENEALARGWKGAVWQKPIEIPGEPELTAWVGQVLRMLLPPFHRLALPLKQVHDKPTGPQLARALRAFWQDLDVEQQLRQWTLVSPSAAPSCGPAFSHLHGTVWEQMNKWLANIELAFSTEALPLREWLPILEAGLGNLTVGVIPPALDQVVIGAIDRSRNPDINLALVLGLNETVFPAPPQPGQLLTENDRSELERRNVLAAGSARHDLARERHFAYLAFTRARQRLVLTCAVQSAEGTPLNPSPFLSQVQQIFPEAKLEHVPRTGDWWQSEHVSEMVGELLKARNGDSEFQSESSAPAAGLSSLLKLPRIGSLLECLSAFHESELNESIAPALAARLYGPVLRTSVSRMEQFAACPFKFFVHSGLRAEERKRFELDVREQGSFQHEVLALFHEELAREHKRWRDLTPAEARQRIGLIASGLMQQYRDGLLQASEQARFLAGSLTVSLQDFVAVLVGWMQTQYQFEPAAVELAFGEEGLPGWSLDLGQERRLELSGRIDRIDLLRLPETDRAWCVVLDYKSSQKKLDPVLIENALQLQLLGYLNVLRHWPNPRELFGAGRLIPAGVFYVNLRGKSTRFPNRIEALAEAEQFQKEGYRHTGRFDAQVLHYLDSRTEITSGDQFNFALNKDGEISKRSREALPAAEFGALLDSVETNLKEMGRRIYGGHTEVAPFRKGAFTACVQCGYKAICRFDPWEHRFRVLRRRTLSEEKDNHR